MQEMVRLEGFKELDTALKKLEKDMGKRKMREVVEAAAVPLEANARSEAPEGGRTRTYKKQKHESGRLKSSIHTIIKQFSGSSIADVKPKTPYAWLVEYGHKIVRVSKKTGRRRVVGFAKANPFMRRAFQSSADKCLKIIEDKLKQVLLS